MRTLTLLFLLAGLASAAEPQTLPLWPGKPPGETTALPPEKADAGEPGKKSVLRISNVSTPTIEVYLPAKEAATGACVLVAPGGGYSILAYEHEGTDVAKWLNKVGIAAAVLKYRVPRRPGVTPDYQPMLQDAQRALALIRSHAKEWAIDPEKVGMMGFSAGGHLTAITSISYAKRAYDRLDAADDLSLKPAFAVLIYPGGLVEKDAVTLKADFANAKDAPPTFLVHASNDKSENSIAWYRALRANNVPAEMHLYATGGHGFGMKPGDLPANQWHLRCEEWLRSRGWAK